MKIGDTLLIYVTQEVVNKEILPGAITAEYEAVSKKFENDTPIFEALKNNEIERFPLRIKMKPVKIFNEPILFKPLISSLSFIKNKKMWSGSLRTAMREIPEEDYQKIIATQQM